MNHDRRFRRRFGLSLCTMMTAGLFFAFVGNVCFVQAEEGDKTIVGISTDVMALPEIPSDAYSDWNGSYVYFGRYYQDSDEYYQPVRWRVLDTDATEFSSDDTETIFLQSDKILDSVRFNESEDVVYDSDEGWYYTQDGDDSNYYRGSNIRYWLNSLLNWKGSNYTESGFLNTAIDSVEWENIYCSSKAVNFNEFSYIYRDDSGLYRDSIADRVFLLSADEILKEDYGYYPVVSLSAYNASLQMEDDSH